MFFKAVSLFFLIDRWICSAFQEIQSNFFNEMGVKIIRESAEKIVNVYKFKKKHGMKSCKNSEKAHPTNVINYPVLLFYAFFRLYFHQF